MMLKLKTLLQELHLSQRALAEAVGVSPATIAQIANHGLWPKAPLAASLRRYISNVLAEHGVDPARITTAFETEKNGAVSAAPNSSRQHHFCEDIMLRKQTLFPPTRQHFGLFRDPLNVEPSSHEDVYLNPDFRYVREAMFQTAKHGGLLAVVAEPGAGKTILKRDLVDRIDREQAEIIVIEPYTIASEDSEKRGSPMRALHIAEAILATIAPLERMKASPEARFRQLHRVLKESHAAGCAHVLVIDEAHSLPTATLKHLKRFLELEHGFRKLLSIILLGQTELKTKLSERNLEVREVVQRCELVELPPLEGARLGEYLQFRFARVGTQLGRVVSEDGVEAMRERLTVTTPRRDRSETVSLLYPLAIGNLLTRAMNTAAEVGAPLVTGDVVRGV